MSQGNFRFTGSITRNAYMRSQSLEFNFCYSLMNFSETWLLPWEATTAYMPGGSGEMLILTFF